ncbi:MAG TPA: amino acid ABC transporter permease [Desulfurobacteriaceae bacterium]|nr:amino acid ABC transporter permease [Desulfurobacteriaceae bacterium]
MEFFSNLIQIMPQLLKGALVTIKITIASIFFGTIGGTIIGVARTSSNPMLKIPATIYVDVIRGTPLLLQIYVVYYGLPSIGINLPAMAAGITALSINSAAYVGEIIRAGIQSIHKGQLEAAYAHGMNYFQAMRYIILPQAFKIVLPALANEFIALLKDSSLVSIIAITELIRTAKEIYVQTFDPWTPYIGAGLIYLAMTLPISKITEKIRGKMVGNL